MKPTRRLDTWTRLCLVIALTLMTSLVPKLAAAGEPLMHVYKSPYCGCCAAWVDHMKANGFRVEVTDLQDISRAKTLHGIDEDLQSCHTAVVDGYLIEGHVPAADVKRLLTERPKAAGLSVPGMPIGSPGMEMDNRTEPYDVVLYDREGGRTVFSRY